MKEITRQRVILDCDPGNGVPATDIDDGLALGLLLTAPNIHLEAITIVSGNTHRDVGYNVARSMLNTVGADVPVYPGAATALIEPDAPWVTRRDSKRDNSSSQELWEDVTPPDTFNPEFSYTAGAELARRVAAKPGEIAVVAIGPLTNIAHAIQLHPGFAHDVRKLVIMGGAFHVSGYLQELNFGIDPEAARLVMSSGADITLVPLDVTIKTTLLHEDLEALRSATTPLAEYLAVTTAPWITYCEAERGTVGCRLHDPLAAALLIEPDLITSERGSVDVQLHGLARSRPLFWRSEDVRLAAGIDLPSSPEVEVAREVDNERLVRLLQEYLTRSVTN
ncbi:nucleoside hydrolase [Nesterenkonia muleiensis]|uniref:nucleoside hydrolase n=1 Tax=Nesterenkonia muleiensis TaxID=2282648 RepID=UPI000E750431|nr:nucleoside hydrolase [Nesterenkonia muleiensis]